MHTVYQSYRTQPIITPISQSQPPIIAQGKQSRDKPQAKPVAKDASLEESKTDVKGGDDQECKSSNGY